MPSDRACVREACGLQDAESGVQPGSKTPRTAALPDEEQRLDLIAFLGLNPEAGAVVPEAGGVRKIRWAVSGRGKRGGVRVIYYFHSEVFPLFLLTAYAKTKRQISRKRRKTSSRRSLRSS